MRFIEITDEEALNLPADQLIAIAVYNQAGVKIRDYFRLDKAA